MYGLVAPGYSMAKVAAASLLTDLGLMPASKARFTGADLSTKLKLLGVERIAHAQFAQPAGYAASLPGHATALPGVLRASEITSMSGIQGAMESGEKAAAIVLNDPVGMSRPRGG